MNFEIQVLGPLLASGNVSVADVLSEAQKRIQAAGTRPIFIELLPRERVAEFAARAEARRARGERMPLFGIPFAIKDNIDLAGVPTTAAYGLPWLEMTRFTLPGETRRVSSARRSS